VQRSTCRHHKADFRKKSNVGNYRTGSPPDGKFGHDRFAAIASGKQAALTVPVLAFRSTAMLFSKI
jgi:hypothetical protein